MANYFTQFAFDLQLTPAEANRLAMVLHHDFSDGEVTPELKELLGDDPIARLAFRDEEYAYFSLETTAFNFETGHTHISAYEGPDIEALANALQLCLDESLPVGFEWANTCDRNRPGGFGGGACVVFKDRIEWLSTVGWVEEKLNG